MTKRIGSNATIAFNYNVGTNLISLIPLLVADFLIALVVKNPWLYLFLSEIVTMLIIFKAMEVSGKYVNKNFIINDIKPIIKWSIGYWVIIGLLLNLLILRPQHYPIAGVVSAILSISMASIITYYFTPKFIYMTPDEEREISKSDPAANAEAFHSSGKRLIKIIAVILGSFIFLLLVPVMLVAILASSAHVPTSILWVVFITWEISIIMLARKFIFRKKLTIPSGKI